MAKNLTERFVATLAAPEHGQRIVFDKDPRLSRKTIKDVTRYWKYHGLPIIGGRPLEAVTFSDVESLHGRVPGLFAANRAVESLRRVYNLAIRWEWCESNPAKGFEANPERPRHQYLTSSQVQRVLRELNSN